MTSLIFALTLSSAFGPVGQGDFLRRVVNAPRPVGEFVRRRAECNHFLGEEPYDRERAAELERAISELNCADIERQERALRRIYRRDPIVLELLRDTEDLPGF